MLSAIESGPVLCNTLPIDFEIVSDNSQLRPCSSAAARPTSPPQDPRLITCAQLRMPVNFLDQVRSMSTGTVKWFNSQKGFGFIQPDAGGADVFVHISAVERAGLATLNDGQKVNYELEKDARSGKMSAGQLSAA